MSSMDMRRWHDLNFVSPLVDIFLERVHVTSDMSFRSFNSHGTFKSILRRDYAVLDDLTTTFNETFGICD